MLHAHELMKSTVADMLRQSQPQSGQCPLFDKEATPTADVTNRLTSRQSRWGAGKPQDIQLFNSASSQDAYESARGKQHGLHRYTPPPGIQSLRAPVPAVYTLHFSSSACSKACCIQPTSKWRCISLHLCHHQQ